MMQKLSRLRNAGLGIVALVAGLSNSGCMDSFYYGNNSKSSQDCITYEDEGLLGKGEYSHTFSDYVDARDELSRIKKSEHLVTPDGVVVENPLAKMLIESSYEERIKEMEQRRPNWKKMYEVRKSSYLESVEDKSP